MQFNAVAVALKSWIAILSGVKSEITVPSSYNKMKPPAPVFRRRRLFLCWRAKIAQQGQGTSPAPWRLHLLCGDGCFQRISTLWSFAAEQGNAPSHLRPDLKFLTQRKTHMNTGSSSAHAGFDFGASSDTAFFENHRSTICFWGRRIATCLYRTPMGSCIEKTVAFYIPHNLKIIKYAQRSLLPSPGANGCCFFCLQRKEASVKWQFFV